MPKAEIYISRCSTNITYQINHSEYPPATFKHQKSLSRTITYRLQLFCQTCLFLQSKLGTGEGPFELPLRALRLTLIRHARSHRCSCLLKRQASPAAFVSSPLLFSYKSRRVAPSIRSTAVHSLLNSPTSGPSESDVMLTNWTLTAVVLTCRSPLADVASKTNCSFCVLLQLSHTRIWR